ncbi:MAG: hypothetical protein U0350_08680 [Caldilineaceae bacterium]
MLDQYETQIMQMTVAGYWEKLVDTGWLHEIPAAEQAPLQQNVWQAFQANPLYTWTALTVTAFDSECIYDVEPDGLSYHAKLIFLADTTYGLFHPTHVYNERRGEQIYIRFQQAGKTYEYHAAAADDYFDLGVIALINQAVRASGSAKQLLRLPVIDQMLYFVVVSPQTYGRAETLGLIPPPEYFIYKRQRTFAELTAYLTVYAAENAAKYP